MILLKELLIACKTALDALSDEHTEDCCDKPSKAIKILRKVITKAEKKK